MTRIRAAVGAVIVFWAQSLVWSAGAPEQLVINEVMTNPAPGNGEDSGFWDSFQEKTRFVDSDWVELYNPGPGAVPLEGLCLSDNCYRFDKFRIGADAALVLAPEGGLLPEKTLAVIWCPGYFRGDYDCVSSPTGECNYAIPAHMAPFRLAAEREWIGLYNADGTLIDGFETPAMPDGRSFGCVPDGAHGTRSYLTATSIGRANADAVNLPPLIDVRSYRGVRTEGTPPEEHFSLVVEPGAEVRVRVEVTDLDDPDPYDDDNRIAEVWLTWKLTTPGSPEHDVQMALADSFAKNGARYEARIPGQAMGAVVAFYVRATDKAGAWSRAYMSDYYDPAAEPKVWFRYPVGGRGLSETTVLINEVLSTNRSCPEGGGGDPRTVANAGGEDYGKDHTRRESDDWVELYNYGAAPVDLATCDLYLTDNELDPIRFPLAKAIGHQPNLAGAALPARTPMLVWCDGQPWQDDEVGVHADMTLDGSEDEVFLIAYKDSDADGDPELFVILDLVAWGKTEAERGQTFGPQDPDWSLGRFPDAAPRWGRMSPTPGLLPYPGAKNSGLVPMIDYLGYEPVMPRPEDTPRVMMRVWDDKPLPALPGADPTAPGWYGVKINFTTFTMPPVRNQTIMRDDGQASDAVAHDGIYTATLPAGLPGKVAYRVTAIDEDLNVVQYPRHPTIVNMLFVSEPPSKPFPIITEVMARNRQCRCPTDNPLGCARGSRDNFGEADDWVELFNPTAASIFLGDFGLSDRLDWLSRWRFPSISLAPGERIIVWCDDELEEQSECSKDLHASFRLEENGDGLYLVGSAFDRQIVDWVRFGEQLPDTSWGRAEGGAEFGLLLRPTPGAPNEPLAARADAIVGPQPLLPGETITVRGSALERTQRVFVVDPLAMDEDEVAAWNWEEALEAQFQAADADLRVTLPPRLANGQHLLCVLSEYDPALHARGAWSEGGVAWTSVPLLSTDAEAQFVRGDVNVDGSVNIADPIALLAHLFVQASAPWCPDAADGNDDGRLDIADAVAMLGYLFGGRGDLPPPAKTCGNDETADSLGPCLFPACR